MCAHSGAVTTSDLNMSERYDNGREGTTAAAFWPLGVSVVPMICLLVFFLRMGRCTSHELCGTVLLWALGAYIFYLSIRYLLKTLRPQSSGILIAALYYTVIYACIPLHGPVGFNDTWQIYELSKSMYSDFGFVHFIRQYAYSGSSYSIAFPPFMPFLASLLHPFRDLSVYALTYVGILSIGPIVCLIGRIASQCHSAYIIPIVGALFLLASRGLISAGSSLIVSYVFYLSLISIVLDEKPGRKEVVMAAALCGLNAMNRFDALVSSTLFLLSVIIVHLKTSRADITRKVFTCLWAILVLVVCVLPWVTYSLSHFGVIYASDNSRALVAAVPKTKDLFFVHPIDFYPEDGPLPTIKDNFDDWLMGLKNKGAIFVGALYGTLRTCTVLYELAPILIIFVLTGLFFKHKKKGWRTTELRRGQLSDGRALVVLLCPLVGLLPNFISGFGDFRYYQFFIFLFLCYVVIFLNKMVSRIQWKGGRCSTRMKWGVAIVLLALSMYKLKLPMDILYTNFSALQPYECLHSTAAEKELASYLRGMGKHLVLWGGQQELQSGGGSAPISSLRLAALEHVNVATFPRLQDDKDIFEFLRVTNITHYYDPNEERAVLPLLKQAGILQTTSVPGLYHLSSPIHERSHQ